MTASVEEWKRRYETARLAHEKARAEIERLDELLWQEAGNRVEIERLRADNEQVRAALELTVEQYNQMVEIARRALEPKP